jgi:hypothetical protein
LAGVRGTGHDDEVGVAREEVAQDDLCGHQPEPLVGVAPDRQAEHIDRSQLWQVLQGRRQLGIGDVVLVRGRVGLLARQAAGDDGRPRRVLQHDPGDEGAVAGGEVELPVAVGVGLVEVLGVAEVAAPREVGVLPCARVEDTDAGSLARQTGLLVECRAFGGRAWRRDGQHRHV